MSCPGNIKAVIKQFKKPKVQTLTNDQILMLAGGTDHQWSQYLKGPKVQSVIRCANIELVQQNMEIISEGISTQRWSLMSCAEARTSQARQQAAKATNHIENAKNNMWQVAKDHRAPERLRHDAAAWLELFHEQDQHKNLLIFEEWADEMMKQLPAPSVAVN